RQKPFAVARDPHGSPEVTREIALHQEQRHPVRLERQVAARGDLGARPFLVELADAQRTAVRSVAAQPVDQREARREEIEIRTVADALEQIAGLLGLLAQLVERQAAKLQMRDSSRRAVPRMLMVAGLETDLNGELELLDALGDGAVPVRREHREKKGCGGQRGAVAEPLAQIDAEPREAISLTIPPQPARKQRRERAVGPRRERRVAVLERKGNHLAAHQREKRLV